MDAAQYWDWGHRFSMHWDSWGGGGGRGREAGIVQILIHWARIFKTFSRAQESIPSLVGPVRQSYLTYRPARLQRLEESIPLNRFLGSLNVYKFGLCNMLHSTSHHSPPVLFLVFSLLQQCKECCYILLYARRGLYFPRKTQKLAAIVIVAVQYAFIRYNY